MEIRQLSMRNQATFCFFTPIEFEGFRNEAGLNTFTMSPTKWVESTNAIGLEDISGRYGGTYAISDIAFEFASWVSVEFKLYLAREFQRLKVDEQKQLAWSAKRELSKINYRTHTNAIKANLILFYSFIQKPICYVCDN